MALDVVRMRVAAVFVIGDDDVRAEFADQLDDAGRGGLHRLQGEGAEGKLGQRVALGEPGVDVAQPAVLDAQDRGGFSHFGAAHSGQVAVRVGQLAGRRVEDVPRSPPVQLTTMTSAPAST